MMLSIPRDSPQPSFLLDVQTVFTLDFHGSFPVRVSRGAAQQVSFTHFKYLLFLG